MATVAIKDDWASILSDFGEIQTIVDQAVQKYTIDQIFDKITQLRQKDTIYQKKYGLDYPAFCKRTAEDGDFVAQLESEIEKMWEGDLADWEFCHKGIKDWTKKLQTVEAHRRLAIEAAEAGLSLNQIVQAKLEY